VEQFPITGLSVLTTVLAISFGNGDDLRCCVGFSAALWGTPMTLLHKRWSEVLRGVLGGVMGHADDHLHKLSSVSYHTRARLPRGTPQRRTNRMDHQVHQEHAHQHGKKCGHTAL